jgi:hypothetical protein
MSSTEPAVVFGVYESPPTSDDDDDDSDDDAPPFPEPPAVNEFDYYEWHVRNPPGPGLCA